MKKNPIAALLVGLALCACHPAPTTQEGSAYKTLTVKPEDRTLFAEYAATLTGCQVVEIRPQVSGLITRICIDEGEKVRKGQTLFLIDEIPYRAALTEAEANVKNAEAKLATARLNLNSTQALYDKKIVQDYVLGTARNELAAAEAALAQANAQATNARNNLSYTEVKSPVNGIAGMITYRVGALVNSNISEPLVTVSDDRLIYAYFSLNESRVMDLMEQYGSLDEFIKRMPEVELRMSNGRIYPSKGRINAISGLVSSGTGAVTLRADFPNDRHLLRDGGSGTVIIPNIKTACIVIPQAATYELQDRIFAYKVVDGKAQSAPISVYRLNDGKEYVVEAGLQAGDVIVAEGAGLVREGESISPKTEE